MIINKLAVITGVTGQDGSYLSEFLLNKNYTVVGLYRRSSTNNFERIKHIKSPNFILEEFDLTDPAGCFHFIDKYQPQEFYNLAAQSHVATSFKQPSTTFEINTIGVVNLLEAIKSNSPATKFYQASTSEMFGRSYSICQETLQKYQDENTPMLPQSPYGIAKLASHNMVQIYRSSYDIFSCSGILFNHESPRRGENFVTRKITKYIGRLLRGETKDRLQLGNLEASRDWGHAKDYVRGMWLMLQNEIPNDYVLCTGQTYTIREFLESSFGHFNLDYNDHIIINPELYRPAEVDFLRGRNDKAKEQLKWWPEINFEDLVKDMLNSDTKNV
jgi:GDPmannose 4,6-dehydratase